MPRTAILGLGQYLPERVVTNDDLAKMFDTSDEWIQQRTGIKERRYVEDGTGPADLAVPATKQALENAGMKMEDIEFIIFATLNPDYFFPGSGCVLQEKLGLPGIGGLAEVHSSGIEFADRGRDVTVLFGDGAGAAILGATEEDEGILSTHLHADGRYVKDLWMEIPAARYFPRLTSEHMDEGRHYPRMNGRKVFKMAVEKLPKVIYEALDANGLTVDDIDILVPHQANLRINELVTRTLKIPPEKVINNIQKYGNTTAGSIPIALNEAIQEGKAKKGDIVMLASFGSGFTWASALIRL